MFKFNRTASRRQASSSKRSPVTAIESLESRQMMSTSFMFNAADGVLTVKNNTASPALYATRSANGTQMEFRTSSDNSSNYDQTAFSRALNGINRVDFIGAITAGNKLTVDPAINKSFHFTGGEAPDFFIGGSASDTMAGFGGADYLYGGPGNDYLYGGQGNDTLAGGSGNDLITGEDGTDTVTYFDRSRSVTINPTGASISGGLSEGERDAISSSNENFIGGAGGDVIYANSSTGSEIRGGAGNDLIYGSSLNDRLIGEAGNDTVVAGLGADSIDLYDGVRGNDVLIRNTAVNDSIIYDPGDRMLSDKSWTVARMPDGRTLIVPITDVIAFAVAK